MVVEVCLCDCANDSMGNNLKIIPSSYLDEFQNLLV
jgi:hypothetical protein